ncbi:inactive ubiquitin carboxyl-terminal hydrolase MINDY-4B [Rhineura floridana]|uniref:inactive ubiquitin carboxyl-terminal hydrolase MINDY-4B n=1 Tax=Rhineura floridana TaxID=261503 RepID=UPI002AC848DE|nr:inactive ubiquitin carboxyl-terminal hydrolase MINDY-4B [Rhineura floridana]
MDKEAPSDLCSLEHMEPQKISSKISDLDKWRKIFSFYGLEISHTTHQMRQDHKMEDDKEDAAAASQIKNSLKHSRFPSNILYSIPKALIVSSNLGGRPISLEMAVGLRKMLFGSTFQVFSYEWKTAYFRFNYPYTDLAYALETDKGGGAAVQMAVQMNIIKYLLFVQNNDENMDLQSLCEVSQKEQEKALATSLVDILWTAGDGQKATVCLVTNDTYFTPSIDYKEDHFTERAILNIILTGRASPHVFNGFQKVDNEGSVLKQLHGVLSRSEVGYLHWSKEEVEHRSLPQVGSMLKTPKLPIWLCNINRTYSVLFSTNRLLLSDWKMEHLFDLYFYNGQPSQKTTVHLTVDTHSHHWEEKHCEEDGASEKRLPSVKMAIRTKWEGAAVNWNGTVPFF